ncbi:unnamed protein product [Musa acuminata subsp. malaccensis]|uniref:(wild Malaysian banana) hypothetical protein n=1 Tax=Musa acuminata subsp. malaccensis TaxID=214687 RepID=A0A804HNG3_MUSAM|nr:unnamed protein product [Musa acuminata subsp. malaccensis]
MAMIKKSVEDEKKKKQDKKEKKRHKDHHHSRSKDDKRSLRRYSDSETSQRLFSLLWRLVYTKLIYERLAFMTVR